jgi:hypothetical protein
MRLCLFLLFCLLALPLSAEEAPSQYSAVIMLEAAEGGPLYTALVEAGLEAIAAEGQSSYLCVFDSLEEVPLRDWKERLFPGDPRNDGFADALYAFFHSAEGLQRVFVPVTGNYEDYALLLAQVKSLAEAQGAAITSFSTLEAPRSLTLPGLHLAPWLLGLVLALVLLLLVLTGLLIFFICYKERAPRFDYLPIRLIFDRSPHLYRQYVPLVLGLLLALPPALLALPYSLERVEVAQTDEAAEKGLIDRNLAELLLAGLPSLSDWTSHLDFQASFPWKRLDGSGSAYRHYILAEDGLLSPYTVDAAASIPVPEGAYLQYDPLEKLRVFFYNVVMETDTA